MLTLMGEKNSCQLVYYLSNQISVVISGLIVKISITCLHLMCHVEGASLVALDYQR